MKTFFYKYILIFTLTIFVNHSIYSQSDSSGSSNKNNLSNVSEIPPKFPGGETALINFINKNIVYPKIAVKKRIQGTVYVRFTINKEGEAVNFEIMNKTKIGYGLEEAAIDVLKKMPKWTPGISKGKPIDVALVIPITFKAKR